LTLQAKHLGQKHLKHKAVSGTLNVITEANCTQQCNSKYSWTCSRRCNMSEATNHISCDWLRLQSSNGNSISSSGRLLQLSVALVAKQLTTLVLHPFYECCLVLLIVANSSLLDKLCYLTHDESQLVVSVVSPRRSQRAATEPSTPARLSPPLFTADSSAAAAAVDQCSNGASGVKSVSCLSTDSPCCSDTDVGCCCCCCCYFWQTLIKRRLFTFSRRNSAVQSADALPWKRNI